MRVLLVEDDQSMVRSLHLMLKSETLNLSCTDNGEEAIELAKVYDHDVIILDIGLPDMTGFDVLRALRQAKVQTPVLVLSGNIAIEAKIKSLDLGADDYMTKPFHRDELIARIYAIVRRAKGHSDPKITVGDLTIDLAAKTVSVSDRPVYLTKKEYQVIEVMALRKGTAISKEMFLNAIYGGLDEPDSKILDVFVCKLRKKLADAGNGQRYIETIWGRGYSLQSNKEVTAVAA